MTSGKTVTEITLQDQYTTFAFPEQLAKDIMIYPSYTIHIFEDLAGPCASPWTSFKDGKVFEIHLSKREEDLVAEIRGPGALLQVLLHEMGHIIGRIFKLPATMQDPRTRNFETLGLSPEESWEELIYAGEVEAWDVAQELIYEMTNIRRRALFFYSNGVKKMAFGAEQRKEDYPGQAYFWQHNQNIRESEKRYKNAGGKT